MNRNKIKLSRTKDKVIYLEETVSKKKEILKEDRKIFIS